MAENRRPPLPPRSSSVPSSKPAPHIGTATRHDSGVDLDDQLLKYMSSDRDAKARPPIPPRNSTHHLSNTGGTLRSRGLRSSSKTASSLTLNHTTTALNPTAPPSHPKEPKEKEEQILVFNAITEQLSYVPVSEMGAIRRHQVLQVRVPKFRERFELILDLEEGEGLDAGKGGGKGKLDGKGGKVRLATVVLPAKVMVERALGKWRELYVVRGVEEVGWRFA